jgi:CheY-like chemotaxis protein
VHEAVLGLTAPSGRTELANSFQPIDVVLCDLPMLDTDGMALIRHIASIDPPPAVALCPKTTLAWILPKCGPVPALSL